MKPLQIAVIGGGHLGTIHVKLLQQIADVDLVAIVEPSPVRAQELAEEFDCPIELNVDRFVDSAPVDAVILAAPTTLHHDLGVRLLRRGVHTLIEKPLASSVNECQALEATARNRGCVLQVGHVERFNPAWQSIQESIGQPRFIQATREGTLTFRSLDAGVVLDLMIHDIDLILSLVKSEVVGVQATGFHWTGPAEDIAHARLTFANGCIAQLSASRVSSSPRRQMQISGNDWYGEVDFAERSCHVIRGPQTVGWQARSYTPEQRKVLMQNLFTDVLLRDQIEVHETNPIQDEQRDFVSAIRSKRRPVVDAMDGLIAVEIATRVIECISMNRRGLTTPLRKAG